MRGRSTAALDWKGTALAERRAGAFSLSPFFDGLRGAGEGETGPAWVTRPAWGTGPAWVCRMWRQRFRSSPRRLRSPLQRSPSARHQRAPSHRQRQPVPSQPALPALRQGPGRRQAAAASPERPWPSHQSPSPPHPPRPPPAPATLPLLIRRDTARGANNAAGGKLQPACKNTLCGTVHSR